MINPACTSFVYDRQVTKFCPQIVNFPDKNLKNTRVEVDGDGRRLTNV